MNKKLGALILLCSITSSIIQGGSTVAFASNVNNANSNAIESKSAQTDKYEYTINANEITITKYLGNDKDVVIPSEIDGVKVAYIGEAAFKDNTNIESVTILEGVKNILFAGFNCCQNLKKVVLPEKLDYIADCAFMNCNNLESIVMPKEIQSIGNSAFCNCQKLKEIEVPKGTTTIGYDFASGCSSLSKVTIPDTVNTIHSGAFEGCTSLRKIEIPSSVKRIEAPFQDLKHIIISGEKGSAAEDYASRAGFQFSDINGKKENEDLDKEKDSKDFKYIFNSKEIEIIEYIGENEDVEVPEEIDGIKVTSIGTNAFKNNNNIKSVKLPDNIQIINSSAFENCKALESINIPENIEKIKDSAFKNCIKLDNIELGKSLTSIGYKAFYGCSSLKSIDIPESVTIIENNSFDNCDSLEEINVSEKNRCYSSRKGILYSSQGKTEDKDGNEIFYINLLKCPGGYKNSNVEIGEDVNYIRFGAFKDAKNVKTLKFKGEKIDIIAVTDLITEKVKEEDLTDGKLSADANITMDNLIKASKAASNNEKGFSIKFGDELETIVVADNVKVPKDDLDKESINNNSNVKEETKGSIEDEKTTLEHINDKAEKDDTGKTADLSSPLSLTFIMSLMGASIIKMFKVKRN